MIILITLFSAINAFAQINQTNTNNTTTNQQTSTQNTYNPNQGNLNLKVNSDAPDLMSQFSSQNSQQRTFAVDKAVNPDLYLIGPNDMFSLGLYGYINQTIPLVVNLEGTLIIPTVGEIKVNGLSLTEAKALVVKAVKKRYYSSEVSLTLSMPRVFLISVLSSVQKKMEVTPLTRPSDIISYIFYDTLDITNTKYRISNPKNEFYPEISLRNIEILRKDGSTVNVDLYRYFSTNDDKYNPYFREGDLLKIPYGMLMKNYITINGAVQLGGIYEYNKNDNLESVIALGRGFDADAETDSITVFRIDPVNSKYQTFNLSYENSKDFKINLYDRVFVKFKTNNIKNLSVVVLGEVNMPGVYPITHKNTTLKEIVDMAGGFKSTAFLPLSILFRSYDEEYTKKDTAEIILNMRANDLIVKEQDKTNFQNDVISRRNRVTVDFEKLFKENDLSQNIILENKDIIYINDDKKIVYVYGQVSNEGYVPYKEGENYEYYISKAGGYSLAAEESDTRIIRFNSRGWYKADKTSVQSGDFIYVPKVVKYSFNENLTLIATLIGTLVSIVSTYLLIKANK
ncbi:MAG: SLBB domain-containing protein [Ignavibacteria bacterium]|nr:SLBB domain-containing protein [Ignavibacteria bacterium]